MEARLNQAFQSAVASKKVPAVGGIVLDKSGNVLYEGGFGSTNVLDPNAAPFTTNTPTMIYSCSKLVTTILALQLMEEGKLSLDDPVEKHDPDFAKIQIFEGVGEDGKPKFRDPKTKATVLHLMTHTSGMAYDFFDTKMLQYRLAAGMTPSSTMSQGIKANYAGPLMFEPGQEYSYGMNTDWVGFVVEAVTGKKLAQVLEERIIKPLQLQNTSEKFDESKPRMAAHMRLEDGNLVAAVDVKPLDDPEVRGGGEFMVCTIHDYAQILLSLLNGGLHPNLNERILKEETVKNYLFSDLISQICSPANVGLIPSSIPQLTNTGEILPGIKKTWSTALLLNETDSPTGRKAGSGAWAGLANTYYFIDPASERLAFFTTSTLPFFDVESLYLFDELERAVYGHESKKSASEASGNYGPWSPAKSSL
jgi:CubicO group peptidase (beta-lactamase class C family)